MFRLLASTPNSIAKKTSSTMSGPRPLSTLAHRRRPRCSATLLPSTIIHIGHSVWIPSEGGDSTEKFPILSHNRLQFRYFDHRKKKKAKKRDNPFKVLNIPEGSTLYKDAKKKFLRIAMKNHPDTIPGHVSDEERDKMRDKFIKARMAFESLAEDPMDGTAILAEDLEEATENFDSWFKSETGFDTPFQLDMDPETMKEVAKMTETLGGGLDRDGGMWALARMVTASVKAGSDAATVLRLEAGDGKGKNRTINGSLRRRRKR